MVTVKKSAGQLNLALASLASDLSTPIPRPEIRELTRTYESAGRLLGIGIAVPGIIDMAAGVLRESPNLPGWQNVPVREEVERLLGGPVSRFSVSDYLLVRSKGSRPLFVKTRRGHYRLVR